MIKIKIGANVFIAKLDEHFVKKKKYSCQFPSHSELIRNFVT